MLFGSAEAHAPPPDFILSSLTVTLKFGDSAHQAPIAASTNTAQRIGAFTSIAY
jgi:hypothetical protein